MIKITPLFAALTLAFAANGPAFATPDRPIIERPAKAERAERPERDDRAVSESDSPRSERPARAERSERPERTERPERAAQEDRPRRTRRERVERDEDGVAGIDIAVLPPAIGIEPMREEAPAAAEVTEEAAPAPKRRGRPRKVDNAAGEGEPVAG